MLRLLLLCFALIPSAGAQEIERPFNGQDLDGWRGQLEYWSVQDGVLVGESTPERPCKRSTYLVWQGEPLADFELTLQFRIPSGNSGVQFRSQVRENGGVSGYQADMEAGPTWTGCLYEQDGRGVLVRRGTELVVDPEGKNQRTRFADDEAMAALVKPGDWNHYRIRAVGPRVELFVNGERTLRLDDLKPGLGARRGVLALQLHAGPPMRVEYKDLELTRLGEGEPEPEAAPADVSGPQWIWAAGEPTAPQAWLRTSFELTEAARQVRLFGTCDNVVEVYLDGRRVAVGDDWARPFEVRLDGLETGVHHLAAWARNQGGPAGLYLDLTAADGDGRASLAATDGTWQARANAPAEGWRLGGGPDEAGWSPAQPLGPWGSAPWGQPTDRSSGKPPEALAGEALELPPGFEAELLYTVPKATQGSWVVLAFDDCGRLITSDQRGALWRVTLGEGGDQPLVERIEAGIGRAQGLLHAFGSLYVMVAEGEGTGLYRLQDADGDDAFDGAELLLPLSAGGEHGPHAIVRHPDGQRLLILAGNHVPLPEVPMRSRATLAWAEDQLLPSAPDPRGHANHIRVPGGWVASVNPDGGDFELIAHGMRNAYDLAVGPGGELFTFDSDMEWDVGTPWYRPTRVLHLASGAEFGWRHGSGKWPDHWEDSVGTVLDLGLASPTGVVFGDDGRFPGRFGSAFYVADWAYGSLHAVHLQRDGASFRGRSEVFAKGAPWPITDLTFGPDGALYVTTGGRGTQSGLYRIHCAEPALYADTEAEAVNAAVGENPAAVRLRRGYEALHGRPEALDQADLGWLLEGLAHRDRSVRFAARTALEQRNPSDWLDLALADPRPRVVGGGVLAAARVGQASLQPRLLEALAALDLEALPDAELRLPVRALQLVLSRHGDPAPAVGAAWAERLHGLTGRPDQRLEQDLFLLLVRLADPRAPGLGLARMAAAETQEQGLFYAFHLRHHAAGWTLEQRSELLRWLDERGEGFTGGASLKQYVEGIGQAVLEGAPEGQRPSLVAARAARRAAPPAPPQPAPFVRAWTRPELEAALAGVVAERTEPGRAAFEKARCFECHRVDGQGGATGPDLTGAGSRFSLADLLTAVHEPSATISDQYQELEVWTHDGRVSVGRLVEAGDETLTLQPSAEGASPVEVELAEIELRRPHPLSRMPTGLLDVLSEKEVRALFAYSLSLR